MGGRNSVVKGYLSTGRCVANATWYSNQECATRASHVQNRTDRPGEEKMLQIRGKFFEFPLICDILYKID